MNMQWQWSHRHAQPWCKSCASFRLCVTYACMCHIHQHSLTPILTTSLNCYLTATIHTLRIRCCDTPTSTMRRFVPSVSRRQLPVSRSFNCLREGDAAHHQCFLCDNPNLVTSLSLIGAYLRPCVSSQRDTSRTDDGRGSGQRYSYQSEGLLLIINKKCMPF